MAIAIIIGGVALSFAAAVVPHFDSAFRLDPLMLAVGVLPYMIYGVLAYFLRGRARLAPGAAVLGLHLLAVLQQRWLTDGYAEGSLLYWVPVVLAAALLALIPQARQGARYNSAGGD
ncbi:MAG: hypothetical protein MUC77_09220 [Chromatiaceae bacterium]|nr:hypothetical protein [Chromatiaceae bacterium]